MSSNAEKNLVTLGTDAAAPSGAMKLQRVRLWDLPIRLFHWLLVASVSTAITTGLIGGEWMVWHGRAGQFILALLVFRVVWGLIGPRTARFMEFVPGPSQLHAYLAGRWQGIGHNPFGALSVLALLTLLALQAGTGLLGTDEISFTGPLASLVDDETSVRVTGLHELLSKFLFVLLGLHVLAVLFYTLVKRDDLVPPMLHGYKQVSPDWAQTLRDDTKGWRGGWLAIGLALLVTLAASYFASGATLKEASTATPTEPSPASTAASPGDGSAGVPSEKPSSEASSKPPSW